MIPSENVNASSVLDCLFHWRKYASQGPDGKGSCVSRFFCPSPGVGMSGPPIWIGGREKSCDKADRRFLGHPIVPRGAEKCQHGCCARRRQSCRNDYLN